MAAVGAAGGEVSTGLLGWGVAGWPATVTVALSEGLGDVEGLVVVPWLGGGEGEVTTKTLGVVVI